MKIAQVIPFFAPAWGFGGPVRTSFEISKRLVQRGQKVTVLTTDAYDHLKRIDKVCEEIDGIKIIRFRNLSNSLAKKFNLYLPLGFGRYFSSHVKEYDIVHLHAYFTFLNATAARICRKHRIPYILHLHESPIPLPIFGKVLLKKLFIFLAGRKMLFGANKIFVLTEREKKNVIGHYPKLSNKIEIVPNGITQKKIVGVDKAALRKKYKIEVGDKVVLSLSRLSRIKRIDLIISALSKINDKSFKLLIAGPDEGNYQAHLQELVKKLHLEDRVLFLGPVEGQEKEDIYGLSDLYVLLSEYESFSITCLEAIQHGLPVCMSREIGVGGELVRHECGTIIDNPENPTETAKKIEWAYNERADLIKNCPDALKQFDVDRIVDKMVKIYGQETKTNSVK